MFRIKTIKFAEIFGLFLNGMKLPNYKIPRNNPNGLKLLSLVCSVQLNVVTEPYFLQITILLLTSIYNCIYTVYIEYIQK